MVKKIALVLFLILPALALGKNNSDKKFQKELQDYLTFQKAVKKTVQMVNNQDLQKRTRNQGLSLVNLTWEDTGRSKGSSLGPNISDVTLQVQLMNPKNEKFRLYCLPVFRYPNFSDKTADLAPSKFYLLVGNEKGKKLKKITLSEYLDNFRQYLHNKKSWKGKKHSLLVPRDTHVLVSAQACFLPILKGKKVEFNPVIFNYQSYAKHPAVLTILATREGTSATIIDNQRDGFSAGSSHGQRLFFNKKGMRAVLSAQRLSDFQKKEPKGADSPKQITPAVGNQKGLNMVLLIQVPLKQAIKKQQPLSAPGASTGKGIVQKLSRTNVEPAVIGHGRVEGPFTEIDQLAIERDDRFPIRVTVQFYKATSNGVVSESDLVQLKKEIDRVYSHADFVGSLVTQGDTGRPTEHQGGKFTPPKWWPLFWQKFEYNIKMKKVRTLALLKKSFGEDWKRMASNPDRLAQAIRVCYEEQKIPFDRGKLTYLIKGYKYHPHAIGPGEHLEIQIGKKGGFWVWFYQALIGCFFLITLVSLIGLGRSIFKKPSE